MLTPIGDRSVELGQTLTIQLGAADPDGDVPTFFATPIPLPAGARLDGATGTFTFTPGADQVGSFPITFSASDGEFTTSETVTVTVTHTPVASSYSGRVIDTDDFVNGITTPVVGAIVQFIGTSAVTVTDANGDFTLTGFTGDSQIIDIVGAAANPAPDGSTYAGFREAVPVIPNANRIVERPFYLPRIDTSGEAIVDPAQTTVVENAGIGVSMTLAPGTAKAADGSDYAGPISISQVPGSIAPAALPTELDPELLITIQPVGITFDPPVRLTFANALDLPPGSDANLWSLEPDKGIFAIVGAMEVSADRSQVDTVMGGVRASTWHTIGPPVPNGDASDEDDACFFGFRSTPDRDASGSLATGDFQTDVDFPSYQVQDAARNLGLNYSSNRASPMPIIGAESTIPETNAVPDKVSAELNVGGIVTPAVFTNTSPFSEGSEESFYQSVQFNGSGLPTGVYDYELLVRALYGESGFGARRRGRVSIHNGSQSPLGAGWAFAGLGRLIERPSQTPGDPSDPDVVLIADASGNFVEFTRVKPWRRRGPRCAL